MNFSQITDDLFIGTTPRRKDYDVLRALGVRLVINMRFTRGPKPRFRDLQIQYLWLRTFDNPLIPIPFRAFMRGVDAGAGCHPQWRESLCSLRSWTSS